MEAISFSLKTYGLTQVTCKEVSHKWSSDYCKTTGDLLNSSVIKQNDKKGFEKKCPLILTIKGINGLTKHKSKLRYKGYDNVSQQIS